MRGSTSNHILARTATSTYLMSPVHCMSLLSLVPVMYQSFDTGAEDLKADDVYFAPVLSRAKLPYDCSRTSGISGSQV